MTSVVAKQHSRWYPKAQTGWISYANWLLAEMDKKGCQTFSTIPKRRVDMKQSECGIKELDVYYFYLVH